MPFVHFLLLGGLLFAGKQLLPDERGVIRVSAADVAQLRGEWVRETRRAPTGAELQAQIRQFVDEEMLLHEALRLGLDRSDPVARGRLVRNMHFIGANGGEPALLEQALALGMQRSDVLVRRRLLQAMQERYAAGIVLSDGELRDYVERNAARYGAQPRVSFRQAVTGSAAALLDTEFTNASESDIARTFGREFAAAVMLAAQGRWSETRSPYGEHRVYVTGRTTGQAPDYDAVRKQAYYALLEERERQAVGEALRALRRHYTVQVEGEVEREALALAGAS